MRDTAEARAWTLDAVAAALALPHVRLRVLGTATAPRAFALQGLVREGWHGRSYVSALGDADPDDAEAVAWLGRALAELALHRSGEYLLDLDVAYRAALPALASVGVGVDSVVLVGEPREALERLVAHRDPPPDLRHLGLQLGRLRRPHLGAAVALRRRVFAAEPQWAWFGAWPEHLARIEAAWAEACEDRASLLYAIHAGDQLVGVCHASIQEDTPWWGRKAGMDLVFDPSIQGRGVIWTVYRVLLERLTRRGVAAFVGGTAQPAVMRLAALMGRWPRSLNLRSQPSLPLAHFQSHLPGILAG
ncbi:MAG: hypothetical protein KC613_17305 [Myxococcales bacterium]|nr:hypothetical protein [Myxococcales bacterium]MCB9525075.1 hypothetical protein [Myxococcales bacterium]